MTESNCFERKISADGFKGLVDFGRKADELDEEVVRAQRDGSVSLYNTLVEHGTAYLADEVGMGKTYQALGVAAVVWALEPSARILVVAPTKAVQRSWDKTWDNFLRDKIVNRENRLTDSLLHRPVHPSHFCNNLVELAKAVVDDPRQFFIS